MSDATTQEQSSPSQDDLIERVRGFARGLLDNGVAPHAVSFTLTYVATELGLAVVSNPVDVFPIVLSAVSQAAASSSSNVEGDVTELISESPFPIYTTIH
jgi:hypothetical protein